jgi:hypothetical protein
MVYVFPKLGVNEVCLSTCLIFGVIISYLFRITKDDCVANYYGKLGLLC